MRQCVFRFIQTLSIAYDGALTISIKTDMTDTDNLWMGEALRQAQRAADMGEVPVGAVLVRDGEMLAAACNHPISGCDPSLHAEIAVMREGAAILQNYRLSGATLYVTIEPCTMCVGAMIHARIGRLVFGAREPRAGAVVSQLQLLDQSHYNHRIAWSEGVLAEECSDRMKAFFASRR
jgi:tRNA(adenine34) deaminase